MNEYIYQSGAVCDVNRPVIAVKEIPIMPTVKSPKNNYPVLIKGIREAKNKAEIISAMRNYIIWNDIPEDIWDKLEENTKTTKVNK